MWWPSVSVVIPVFNGAKYLRHTIESVLAQSYPEIEIVAVDDGSSDDSPHILKGFDNRVRVIRQPNFGVAVARNRGILAARGDCVAFLDQDDWWRPEKVSRQVACLDDPSVGLVHTHTIYFDDLRQEVSAPLDPEAHPEEYVGWCYEKLLFGNAICNSSVIVRRELFARSGLCDLQIAGNTVQDYDLWLRLARITQFAYVAEPLTVFRLHPAQGTVNRRMMLREQIKVRKRHWRDVPPPLRRAFARRLAQLYDLLGSYELDYRDHRAARAAFAESLSWWPHWRAAALWLASLLPPQPVALLRRVHDRWKQVAAHKKNIAQINNP